MADAYTFVPLRDEYLGHCADICATAPDPWSIDALRRAKDDPNRWTFVALPNEGAPVGFACFLAVAGSCDLETLAIAETHRRQGIASALLAEAFATLRQSDVQRCLLEVRASNTAAIALYKQLGFKTLARRPGMYQHPNEDGFLMARGL